jgi:hypothetical protein
VTRASENQLGFDALLRSAEEDNRARELGRQTSRLPGAMDEAIPFYRLLIRQHHAAMLAANVDDAMRVRKEADLLALRLNGGEPGILAHENSPGNVLTRETAALAGTVPLWGQAGEFVITMQDMRVRIELEGMFGIGSSFGYWPGFSAHAVDWDRPFISETGYRSFLGIHAEPVPGLLPDEFAAKVIAGYVARDLKGKLRSVNPQYRPQAAGAL